MRKQMSTVEIDGRFVFGANRVVRAAGQISVDPETGHFIDKYGRVRIFHGVNAVLKDILHIAGFFVHLKGL